MIGRTLRGAWSRRWTLLPLLVLTVIVVAGTVAVVTFAEAADTSASLAVPLLVLGLVAVPATARELAEAQRGELGLARLRGVYGGQLSALASREPLLVLVIGGILGLVLGGGVGRSAIARLAPEAAPARPGLVAVLAGLAIVVVGLLAVLAGMTAALTEPLSDQVRSARRPRRAGVAAVSVTVLTIVAAVVATYRASVAGDQPDIVVLAAPALVGLAVGQLTVSGLQGLSRVLVRVTRRRGLGGFLAVRRLARVADVASPLRLVIAAATVATLALTGALQVSAWSEQTAKLRAGGPQSVLIDGATAGEALALTQRLDPDGDQLMAAVVVPGTGSEVARRAYLDLTRYDAVLGDFYAGTPVAAAEPVMHDLVQAPGVAVDPGAGPGRLSVGVRGVSRRAGGELRASIRILFTGVDDSPQGLTVLFDVPRSGRSVTTSLPLGTCATPCVVTGVTACASPCTVAGVTVAGGPEGGSRPLPFVIDRLDDAGTDLLDLDWAGSGGPSDDGAGIVQVDDGLLVPATATELTAEPQAPRVVLPVIATTSATWDGAPTAETPGGDDREAVVVARAAALPLVEADGLLLDLATAQVGAAPTVPAAEVRIVAAADTTTDLRRALEGAAGAPLVALDEVEAATTQDTRATQASVYALMAGACLLIALLALVTAFARQRASWRRDVAALRVVGLSARTLAGAARIEVALLGLTAAVGTVIGGLLAVRLLLSHLALVRVPEHAITLRSAVEIGPIVAGATGAAVVVVVAVGWGRAVAVRRSQPAILREEETG